MKRVDIIIVLTMFTAGVQLMNACVVNDIQFWIATVVIWCLAGLVILGRIEISRMREWIDAQT